MKIRILLIIVIIVFLGGFQTSFAQKILKSKGFAGFGYQAVTQADVDSLGLTDTQGVIINRILPHTPAEQSGFQVNDVLKKYDDAVIEDNIQFVDIYQQYYAGDTIHVTFIRNGELKTTNLILSALPREKNEDLNIEYTSFPVDSIYLRAVITSPLNREDKKLPALLIVSALSSYPLIELPYYNLPRELAYDISRAGFRVLRFELRGYGDSEGKNFRTADFNTEVKDNLAEVYSSITEPVLIIYGSSDFLTQQACHETIKEVLLNSGNNGVELNIIPDLDHAYAFAKDKEIITINTIWNAICNIKLNKPINLLLMVLINYNG
ncbi:MAG: PDZ domain-containing protein [bacterium]